MRARCIYAATDFLLSSQRSADLYWKTGFSVTDPVFYVETEAAAYLLVNMLEIGRARTSANQFEAVEIDPILDAINSKLPENAYVHFLKEKGITEVHVPKSFPAMLAAHFSENGIKVSIERTGDAPWYPERVSKSEAEVAKITAALRSTEEVMRIVEATIRASSIGAYNTLYDREGPLTSERMHALIMSECWKRNLLSAISIAASGNQPVDPHERGHGPLLAHSPIVVDIFPRSLESGYCADMTRTFFKGQPTDEGARLYQAVLEAQSYGMSLLRAGVNGSEIWSAVTEWFTDRGYPTEERDGVRQGFIHGFGHGVGLELHEGPGLGRAPSTVPLGAVITPEPGLYYVGVGGVRIEDMVVVTETGYASLSRFPKTLDAMIL